MSNRRPGFEPANKDNIKEALQDVLGGGVDIDSGNPLSTETFVTTTVISSTSSETIAGGETAYYPDSDGISIDGYALKTITIKADYALTGAIEVSDDDGGTWDRYYPKSDDFTMVANQLKSMSFEEDFGELRIKLINGDAGDHIVEYVVIKGRNI